MTTTPHIPPRATGICAMLAAAALAVCAIIQVTDSQSSQTTVVGVEHVTLGALSALLLLLVPATLHLGALAGRPRVALAAVTGQALLAALCVVSNVRGEDPSFFAAVAVPTNLLWLGGWIAIGVGLRRRARAPLALAVGLPLCWVATMPLSAIGGTLLAGFFWLAVGWLLLHDALPVTSRPSKRLAEVPA